MKRTLWVFLLFAALAWAADFKPAKILDVRDASEVGANTVTDSSEGVSGAPKFVPAMLSRCQITVALDGVSYTAVYPVNNHLRLADLNVGDFIPTRIEANKMVIKALDGKEIKAKIAHRETIDASETQKPPANKK
jgi:hypothetical protein